MDTKIFDDVLAAQARLKDHRVFGLIGGRDQLATFMAWHVFAVWDFMSLVKSLQRGLTSMQTIWLPPENPTAARLINEIVLAEESDELPGGGHLSHFEIYRQAMIEVGADTHRVDRFLERLQAGESVELALQGVAVPGAVQRFVLDTLDVVRGGDLVEVLGSFYFGREDIIPEMFSSLLTQWQVDEREAPMFVYYLQRHIDLDGDSHGPAAWSMIEQVTAGDGERIDRLRRAAMSAIDARLLLWDGLALELEKAGTGPLRCTG